MMFVGTTTEFAQELVLGLVLFNDEIEYIFTKFHDDRKMGGVTDTVECCATVQLGLDRLES